MKLTIKKGARVRGIRPEIVLATFIISDVLHNLSHTTTITEGTGGRHGRGSLHFSGNAVDIRTRHIPSAERHGVRYEIARRLNNEFDVVLEATHIHVEFQPKS